MEKSNIENINEYQEAASKTIAYDKEEMKRQLDSGEIISLKALSYVTLGLNGEAGEVANKVKKLIIGYGKNDIIPIEKIQEIRDELGDVMWYAAILAKELGVSLSSITNANIDKLRGRKERGTLIGSGDNR